MLKYFSLVLMSIMACCWQTSAWAGQCYNLERKEPSQLTGIIEYIIFPGPPNYEDVQNGDTPEPSYVLKLSNPICLSGDEFADPKNHFQSVQLVGTKATSKLLQQFLHKNVTVQLTDTMAAATGHHHEPLVATVTAVRPVSYSAPQAKAMDFIDEYGTAATTIRAFYTALGDGQGAAASALVVPEKRSTPAFLASNLTKFYGSLTDRIQLLDIAQESTNIFIVRYHYAAKSHICNGRASIMTSMRNGRNFIQSIHALNGC
ncbi:hypothetical protein [Zymomonas mobilis]|uniref:DUF4431 domain-containing protein n=1 Tax=Zymomonas mobilis subsp. mobilis (strain ATCC 10988 / DSM 424 / LMG 404 / NCIMB 8938 / NRRL B-806 / ZM1) TaxID=555217 RepID=A0A0H3G104_ZYMMA|nr:hypothetical protein [Zymomonas mobilis]AEH63648.1 conserved hypothetical protein [Zymomonas mobilis subsp. mobilis ATCC 10988]TQL24927.1 hypothetical protein FBY55_1835 [Zymomonas mobilis]